MKTLPVATLFIPLFLALTGCATREAAQVPLPTIEMKVKTGTEATPAWQEEWEQLVREAKKEGTVVIYAAFGSPERTALVMAFKQKYGVDLDITQGRGGEVAEKIIRENRAGLNLADVIIAGGSSLTINTKPAGVLGPLEPLLLLPEVKDPQVWWDKKLPFLDKENTIFEFLGYVNAPITINVDMVKAGDIVSMRDVLNPGWKDKIVMDDPTIVGGAGINWFSRFSELLGYDFMRAFARMEPVITRDRRLAVEWIARGKYPVGVAASDGFVAEFVALGAPIAPIVPKEGTWISAGAGVVSIAAKAPHRNAAKLFINWLLSPEGQTIYSKAQGTPSNRVDVATDHLPPYKIRQAGVNYVSTNDEESLLALPQKQKEAREIFGPLLK
ncbi:MAG: extracellular solute-binding protein [Chloroflexi bacterium]|nr:extracellular solute-binding protein [Chloroflexota bacterium]